MTGKPLLDPTDGPATACAPAPSRLVGNYAINIDWSDGTLDRHLQFPRSARQLPVRRVQSAARRGQKPA